MRATKVVAAAMAVGGAAGQLNALAKDAGLLYFGTAMGPSDVNDAPYYKLESDVRNFGQWTPDNAQKWDATEASRGTFTFTTADGIITRATANKQIMRCHTLVWYSQLPSWGSWTKATMTDVINSHISHVMGHFKGKCYAWDVVNEALEDDGTYRQNVFLKVLGDSYFAVAFKAAAAADPAAKLYYNDCRWTLFFPGFKVSWMVSQKAPTIENVVNKFQDNLEYFPVKADGAVRIAKLVQDAGVPIHGIGFQGHMTVGRTPSRDNLTWTLNKYTALGLDVAYTELDVRIKTLPSNATTLGYQAKEFENLVGSCLDVPRCVGITVWGFGDSHSWIPQTFSGAGDATLYDKQTKPKPAYSSISALLASASGKRPPWNTATSSATVTPMTSATPTTPAPVKATL